ncbi:phage N-6-adenine-methyltransferase [Bradyrhizobium sp. LB1.3]
MSVTDWITSTVPHANDNQQTGLMRYDAACRAISEALAVDEIKGIHDKARAMAAAAKVAKNKRAEADMMAVRFRAERRIGEIMAMQRDAGLLAKGGQGSGSNQYEVRDTDGPAPITLPEMGIDKHLADRARKYAAVPEEEFEARVYDYRTRVQQEGDRATADLLAAGEKAQAAYRTSFTGDNEWYTPARYVELARTVLGQIDVDPASNPMAQETVRARTFYTAETDGLDKPWLGKVWMNPPYSQPEIVHFVDKLIAEYKAGNVKEAIMLTHNSTDTKWFDALFKSSDAICFTTGRVKFVSPKGEFAAPAMGQAFSYFRPNPRGFTEVFSEVGNVVTLANDNKQATQAA